MITMLPQTTTQPITAVATDAGLLKMRALKRVSSLKKIRNIIQYKASHDWITR